MQFFSNMMNSVIPISGFLQKMPNHEKPLRNCHFYHISPFIEKLGFPVPAFDFRVPGVTSISADAHKYGYAPEGASVILYRNSKLRKHQFFVYTDWPGGIFGTPCLQGTKSGASIVATWALIHLLGIGGYLKRAGKTMEATRFIQGSIKISCHVWYYCFP